MSWSWNTGPIPFDALCRKCGKTLRGDSNIVTYNGADYHVGCLLDKLTSAVPEDPLPTPWGLMGAFVGVGNAAPIPPGPVQVYPTP